MYDVMYSKLVKSLISNKNMAQSAENGTRRNVRNYMFNNTKKVIAWRMNEMWNEKSLPWLHTHLHQMELPKSWSTL